MTGIKVIFHFTMGIFTGGLWWIGLGIWYVVKK